jgi:hypothetical protein
MDGREPVDYSDFGGEAGDIGVTSEHGSMLDVMRANAAAPHHHQAAPSSSSSAASSSHSRSTTPSYTPSSHSDYDSASTSTSSSVGSDHDYRRYTPVPCPLISEILPSRALCMIFFFAIMHLLRKSISS